jgi:hypothetical protein
MRWLANGSRANACLQVMRGRLMLLLRFCATQRYASPRAEKSYEYYTDIAALGIGITVLLSFFILGREA